MIKIGMLGVSASLLALILKKEKAEYAVVIALAAGVFVFAYIVAQIALVVDFMEGIMETLPFETDDLWVLFKMLGITYVAEFASNICKDAGYQSVAGQIEVFAKLAIVVLSIPCLTSLVELVGEFL